MDNGAFSEEDALAATLALSLDMARTTPSEPTPVKSEEDALAAALAASLENLSYNEELARAVMASMDSAQKNPNPGSSEQKMGCGSSSSAHRIRIADRSGFSWAHFHFPFHHEWFYEKFSAFLSSALLVK